MNEPTHTKDVFDKAVSLGGRIIRWGLYGLGGLIALGLLIWGGAEAYTYLTETRHENNVEVLMRVSAEACPDEYPIEVVVLNDSKKTIKKVSIYPTAHREGYSNDLAGSASIVSDKIIAPAEGFSVCWRGELDYLVKDEYDPAELMWEPETYYIEFQ